MKTEILFGIHPVYEALKAGKRSFVEIYISKDKSRLSARLEQAVSLAESRNIPVKISNSKNMQKLTGSEMHQGIGAKTSVYSFAGISDLFSNSEPFILILDSIVDTHNLGALIRTAQCAGVSGIIIPKDRAAGPSPAVSKASAGALEHVSLIQAVNLVNIIKELKKKGVWIFGLAPDARESVFEKDLKGPGAVIIGGEEKGIRPGVKKHCDFLISIPQKGHIDSLNASVAGAVVMYEAFRQRLI